MNELAWTAMSRATYSLAPLLAIGITLFLAVGCGLMLLTRSPVHRQRWGELALMGAFTWALLALIPLPRLLPDFLLSTETRAPSTGSDVAHKPPVGLDDVSLSASLDRQRELPLTTVDLDPVLSDRDLSKFNELVNSPPRLPVSDRAPQMVVDGQAFLSAPDKTPQSQPRALRVGPIETQQAEASEASTATRASTPLSWTAILSAIYLTGAFACVLWLLIGQILLMRIQQKSLPVEPWLAELFRTLTPVTSSPQTCLIVSSRCRRALSWGVWRPMIVLPESLCRPENQGQLRTILLHELGHIAQGDARGNLLTCLALPLLYVHPLFWWLRFQIRLAAELIADDWAAQQTGKAEYVEELVALAKVTACRGILLPGVTGVLSSPSQFYRRMNMLLNREEPLLTRPTVAWRLMSLGASATAVVLAATLAGVHPAAGQQVAPVPPVPAAVPAAPGTEAPPSVPVLATTPPTQVAPAAQSTPSPPIAPVVPPAQPVEPNPPVPPIASTTPTEGITPAPPRPGTYATGPNTEPGAYPIEADSETAKLRSELRKMMHRLHALESNGAANLSSMPAKPVVNGRVILSNRIDADGTLTYETWLADKSGNPEKLLSSTKASALTPVLPPGTEINVVGHRNGERVLHRMVIGSDGNQHFVKAVPDAAGLPRRVQAPGGTSPYGSTLAGTPVAVAQPKASQKTSGDVFGNSPQRLDLVSLATSYADAVGAVQSAKSELEELEGRGEASSPIVRAIKAARVALDNAHRKEQLLRRIAQSATANAKREYERLDSLIKAGRVGADSLQEVEGRLEILNQILDSHTAGDNVTTEPKPTEVKPTSQN